MRPAVLTVFAVSFSLAVSAGNAQGTRASSDYELARAERELRENRSGFPRIAAHLNLADVHASRGESRKATAGWSDALEESESLRISSRKASDMDRYARATGYAALAKAKLGRRQEALRRFEEATRYIGDSAAAWNLFASGMLTLREFEHSIFAASNAVTIAERAVAASSSSRNVLDLSVYRYGLASALTGAGRGDEAVATLSSVIASLESPVFDDTREDVASSEEFEILSSVARDSSAYVTLLARSRLRLAALYEERGKIAQARVQYERTLAQRSDEPRALAALARLSTERKERERLTIEAFDADPFSAELLLSYTRHLQINPPVAAATSTGGLVRAVLEALHRGRFDLAAATLRRLRDENRDNDTLRALTVLVLRGEGKRAAAKQVETMLVTTPALRLLLAENDLPRLDLRRLNAAAPSTLSNEDIAALAMQLKQNRMSAEDRALLDLAVLQQSVRPVTPAFDGANTTFASGTVGEVRFRFAAPSAFKGDFTSSPELQLRFTVLGWSDDDQGGALLVEPLGVSR